MTCDLSKISTLSDFFLYLGGQHRVFDMGRRITKLSAQSFSDFETCKTPYPFPWLKHAWVGFLLWPKGADYSLASVWFIKFPLDEQGFLIQASRDEFLAQLLEAVSTQILTHEVAADVQTKMQESPLAFTPNQERMAAFHARGRVLLKQPPSSYLDDVRIYFGTDCNYDRWQHLGLQGIADAAVAMAFDRELAVQLTQGVTHIPLPVLVTLCGQCEHLSLPKNLADALLERGRNTHRRDEQLVCLRGISASACDEGRRQWLQALLCENEVSPELLAVIASRCQEDLDDQGVFTKFLEASAQNVDVFCALVGELMFQSRWRQAVLAMVRSTDRSECLAKAFEHMLSQ